LFNGELMISGVAFVIIIVAVIVLTVVLVVVLYVFVTFMVVATVIKTLEFSCWLQKLTTTGNTNVKL
jgi:hypothetical protein